MIGHAPVASPALEPITMAGLQAMMKDMLDRPMEETRQLLRENKDERTAPVVQSELNKE